MMRTFGIMLTAVALFFAPATSVADPESDAKAIILETIDDVIGVLTDPDRDVTARRSAIEEIAYARFDFKTMSRLVLAKNWKRLSEPEQDEFVKQFTQYLANDYGSRIERYEQEKVEVIGTRVAKRGDVTVKSKIIGGVNSGAVVSYRMRKRDAGWKIIDVTIEGISLVANFRDQFRDVMGKGGPQVVLEKLKQKNAGGA